MKPDGQGVREGMSVSKLALGLIPPQFLAALAGVLEYGARKYTPHNWARGMSWSVNLESIERHLMAFKAGERIDRESGLPHLAHAACGVMFAWWYAHGPFRETYAAQDDLYWGAAEVLDSYRPLSTENK